MANHSISSVYLRPPLSIPKRTGSKITIRRPESNEKLVIPSLLNQPSQQSLLSIPESKLKSHRTNPAPMKNLVNAYAPNTSRNGKQSLIARKKSYLSVKDILDSSRAESSIDKKQYLTDSSQADPTPASRLASGSVLNKNQTHIV